MFAMNLFSTTHKKTTLKRLGIFSSDIRLKVKKRLVLQMVASWMRMGKFLVFLMKKILLVPMVIVISTVTNTAIADSVGIVIIVSRTARKSREFVSSGLVERGK